MKRSRLLLIAAVLGVILGFLWLYRYTHRTPVVSYQSILLKEDTDRRAWLAEYGYPTTQESPRTASILIPIHTEDNGTFGTYCTMQEAQQLPFAASAGAAAAQITYSVQSSSSESELLAELLIRSDGTLIGAMVYDPANPEQFQPILTY